MHNPILSPLIALVLWTFVMCGWLYATRIPALSKHKIVYDPRRPSEEFHAQLPAEVRWKADNYNNLLEQPTLFYAVVLTLAFLSAGSGLNAGLAWLYVALRIVPQSCSGDHQQCHDQVLPLRSRLARIAGDDGTRSIDRVLSICRLHIPVR